MRRIGKMAVWVRNKRACAIRLSPFASSSNTALSVKPRVPTQASCNTGLAAFVKKPHGLCVGVDVSEHSAVGFSVVNYMSSLRSSYRGTMNGRFLRGGAAKIDTAANYMTFKARIAFTTRNPVFSRGISAQSRVRSMIMLTPSQVPQRTPILPPANPLPLRALVCILTALSVWMRQEPEAGVQGEIDSCVKKIGECEAEIAGCVAKIDDVEKELMKEGISADNLVYWRKEKEQLRDEKKQYLKNLEQLREKELLLTKSLVNGARARTLKRLPSPSRCLSLRYN